MPRVVVLSSALTMDQLVSARIWCVTINGQAVTWAGLMRLMFQNGWRLKCRQLFLDRPSRGMNTFVLLGKENAT